MVGINNKIQMVDEHNGRKREIKMAFDPQATAWHESHTIKQIDEALDELQNKKLAEIISIVLRANRDYTDAEDENILSEVKDIDARLIDDPEERLQDLEETVEQLKRENRYMLSKLNEFEKAGK